MNGALITIFQIFILLIFKIECSNDFQLLLLHNNNINFNFEEDEDNTGGAARALYLVNKFREEAKQGKGPPVLYLNAGDTFSHTRSYTMDRWKVIADFLNVLRPDAICLGNHDLNLRFRNLTRFLQRLEVPVVGSNFNLKYSRILSKYIKPSHVVTINNFKIGIIGVTTTRLNIPFLPKQISLEDEIESVKKECSRLHEMGVKIIILLSHSGAVVDETIARVVDYIDVVVASRRKNIMGKQRKYWNTVRRKDGKYIPIIYEEGHMKNLGVFKVTFNKEGNVVKYNGESMLLHGKIPQEKRVLRLLTRVKRADKTLGVARVTLSAECQNAECNFGNLLADALCDYKSGAYHQKEVEFWSDYPMAIVNAGTIRKRVRKGATITVASLKRNMLFDDTVVYVRLKGIFLRRALLRGTQYYGYQHGYFLQFSGIHVRYNLTKAPVDRITRLYARCGQCAVPEYAPVEDKKTYNVILNSQTYLNVEPFNKHKISFSQRYTRLGEILGEYIKNHPNITAEEHERLVVEEQAVKSVVLQPFLFVICVSATILHEILVH